MVSLLDVGEASEPVPIRGTKVDISGISAKGLLVLLTRFPEVRKLVASRGQDVSAEDLIKLAPDAIACVIAAGCGTPGDEAAEAKAASLNAGEQLDLLTAILKLTFPGGIGPFVEKLTALAGASTVGGASGWEAAMKSPEELNSVSHPGIHRN